MFARKIIIGVTVALLGLGLGVASSVQAGDKARKALLGGIIGGADAWASSRRT